MSTSEKFAVLYDISNTLKSAQAYSGNNKGYKDSIPDSMCMINAKKLIGIAFRNRSSNNISKFKAYGQMTKDDDSELMKNGYKVVKGTSLELGKESIDADTQMTADGLEFIMNYKDYRMTLILFTNDKFMLPLINKARKYKCNVEIYAFKHSLTKEFEDELQRIVNEISVKIVNLEDKFDEFTTFTKTKRDNNIIKETSLKITLRDFRDSYERLGHKKREDILANIESIFISTLQLPTESTHMQSRSSTDVLFAATVNLPVDKFNSYISDICRHFRELEKQLNKYLQSELGRDVAILVERYEEPKNNLKRPFKKHEYSYEKTRKIILCWHRDDEAHLQSEAGRKCKFAHSLSELVCGNCGVSGDHEQTSCTESRRKRINIDKYRE